ncbi:MAG TPA: type II/IV secretion system ATPase subunit [archaeon]|nr:type II/IV secretion system ATPase subunit [archaeon]
MAEVAPRQGSYTVKEEGGKRILIIDARDASYIPSFADDRNARFQVLKALTEVEASLVVLAEVYERVYDEGQTKMLAEIAAIYQKFESENVWSYSHLGDAKKEAEKDFGRRHNAIVRVTHDELLYDPILSYIILLEETGAEKNRLAATPEENKSDVYLKSLTYIRQAFESTELIRKARVLLAKLEKAPDTNDLYRSFFEAQVKPSFIGSRLVFGDEEKLELLDEYSVKSATVQIFKHPNKPERLYFVSLPEYSLSPEKYFLVSKTKETVASFAPGRASLSTLAKSRRYFERIYQSTIRDIAKQERIEISGDEIIELSEIVARYTVGYGVLEILLSDRRLTDIFIDAPIGNKLIYVVHSEFGQCQTNIIYTQDEADSFASKLRAMSGRPFDEAHPVLDYDLPGFETRVAAINPPLSPDGSAFAFRLHKTTPWTLPQFIDVKFLTPLSAGLLSFFIDSQATMLVTGSRGSGKTSLMGALMLEILQNSRLIVQEDTLELPVDYMKSIGFNVQRLKTRSPIGAKDAESSEVAPEEALRTALRLGDSALIIGEVRSREAKVLYEAMRVGAAGNIVMGTIHGDSAYSVWDRVVNDLEVPNTSFKATDVVVVARPIRFKGSLERHRRVTQMTEVKKHWLTDPANEGGLLDLMQYDAKNDSLDLIEDNLKESDLFSRISSTSGLAIDKIWKNIRMVGESKSYLVELKNEFKVPELLEAENTVIANNKLVLLKEEQLEEFGSVDYSELLGKWKNWAKTNLLKRVKKGLKQNE